MSAKRTFSLSRKPKPPASGQEKSNEENQSASTNGSGPKSPVKPPRSPLRASRNLSGQHPLAAQQRDVGADTLQIPSSPERNERNKAAQSDHSTGIIITSSPDLTSESGNPMINIIQDTNFEKHSQQSSDPLSVSSGSGTNSTSLSVGRKRTPSDASTGMQATSTWFSGSVTDEDEDDIMIEPVSPPEFEWSRGSISPLGTKDDFDSTEDVQRSFASNDLFTSVEAKVDSGVFRSASALRLGLDNSATSTSTKVAGPSKPNRRAETLPNTTASTFASTDVNRSLDAKINRSVSKSLASSSSGGGSGILGRLRRISKREKRAATMEEKLNKETFPIGNVSNVKVKDAKDDEDRSLPTTIDDDEEGESADIRHIRTKSDLPIQNASRERTIQFGGIERMHSIHSVQPSLVDDESIADRDSLPGSPLYSEEEWEEADVDGDMTIDRTISTEENIGAQRASGDRSEDNGWHLQSIPGSFFTQREEESTERPVKEIGDRPNDATLLDKDVTSPSEAQHGQIPERQTTIIPEISVDSSSMHPSGPSNNASEYTQALSRQTSDINTYSGEHLTPSHMVESSIHSAEEEDGATPRAVSEANRSSYFDVPSVKSPSLEAPSTPQLGPLSYEEAWLDKVNLAHEERHYFVRHLVTKQLSWELDRLFLIKSTDDLERHSLRSKLPKTDLTYFKANLGDIVPDLPILRLLVRHVFLTCPIFSVAMPIEGAAAERTRNTNARLFLDQGILPLLRFFHTNSISNAVELNGEWQDEMFDAPSTLQRMQSGIFNLTSRFITSLTDGIGHGFLWSKVPAPAQGSFFDHRKPLNMLKQGGCEVNVLSARVRPTTRECEFIVSVHRYGFPPVYVIRSESDFYNYAITLAQELGPQARVRPVPAPDTDLSIQPIIEDDEYLSAQRSTSSSPTMDILNARRVSLKSNQPYKASNGSSSSSSSLQNVGGTIMSRDHVSHDSLVSRSITNGLLSQPSLVKQNKSTISLVSQKSTSRRRESVDSPKSPIAPSTLTGIQRDRSGSRIFSAGRPTFKNSSTSDLSTLANPMPITTDEEARRKQVRAWLRDTLSIRGAGHAKETKAFLENDAFLERDLKPGSRKDIQSRLEVDEVTINDRKRMIDESSRDVIELRQEMMQLWRECIENNGFEKALSSIQQNSTFSTLPLPYQRMISWTNLQVATFLHHTFLDSHEARRNFDRFQEFVTSIPWKTLSMALRERTGLMMQKVQSAILEEFVQKKLLAIMLEDVPKKKIEIELEHLRERLGSTVMIKLEIYSKSTAWQKRMIRRAAKQADIPLVAAIMRGSDQPLLSAEGIKKVVSATAKYQEFMRSQPTYNERKAKLKANVEVRKIYDMQCALRLYCQQRDGKRIRETLKAELKPMIKAILQPLMDLLRRLHRSKLLIHSGATLNSSASSIKSSSKDEKRDVILDFQQFCLKLLDVLAALRMRVQDPWRSLSTLTLLLDDAVPEWYQLLHASSLGDSFLNDLTQWLQSITNLLRFRGTEGSGGITDDILARFWARPANESQDPLHDESSDRLAIEKIVEHAWHKRTRQMETACRWATGDSDGHLNIQLMGEGGKTRMSAYEMKKMKIGPSAKDQFGLDKFLPAFRVALDRVLTADPGTAW